MSGWPFDEGFRVCDVQGGLEVIGTIAAMNNPGILCIL